MFNRAILKGNDIEGGRTRLIVVYLGDAGEEEVKNYYLTDEVDSDWLKRTAKREIKALNAIKSYVVALELGEIDLSAEVTKEESARIKYLNKYRRYLSLKSAYESGLPCKKLVDDLLSDLVAKYKDEFMDFL